MAQRGGPVSKLFGALRRVRNMDSAERNGTVKSIVTSPVKLILALWILSVLVVGIIWLLVSIGAFNHLMSHRKRKQWEEITVQILNGLFTLGAFLQQIRASVQSYLLYRYNPEDAVKLEKALCKDGLPKPNERKHMLVVILLTHVSCFAQYASAVLYWVYPNKSQRPTVLVNILFFFGLGSFIGSRRYLKMSPLGRDYPPQTVESNQEIPRMDSEGPIIHAYDPKLHSPDQYQSYV